MLVKRAGKKVAYRERLVSQTYFFLLDEHHVRCTRPGSGAGSWAGDIDQDHQGIFSEAFRFLPLLCLCLLLRKRIEQGNKSMVTKRTRNLSVQHQVAEKGASEKQQTGNKGNYHLKYPEAMC